MRDFSPFIWAEKVNSDRDASSCYYLHLNSKFKIHNTESKVLAQPNCNFDTSITNTIKFNITDTFKKKKSSYQELHQHRYH